MTRKKDLFGAHLSSAGGPASIFKRATMVGAHSVQLFTKSNKSYFGSALSEEACSAFADEWAKSDVQSVVTHAAYLINIAASNPAVEKKSCDSLKHEIERCHQLRIPYLVLHPGSHTGAGVEQGIEKIGRNLSAILEETSDSVMVLLETAAGQGTNLGSTFEELRAMYDACSPAAQKRIGICFDTCHVFSAGYDIATQAAFDAVFAQCEAIVGRGMVKVMHLNDSLTPCGSRRDRHANLGKGTLPVSVLTHAAHEMEKRGITVILETPSDDGITEYKEELGILRTHTSKEAGQ
jgi:deoxyribonuclease-4